MEELLLKIGGALVNVNNIESEINDVIANYYTKHQGVHSEEAYLNILGDIIQTRHMTLGAKREILTKIFKRTDNNDRFKANFSNQKFEKWIENRNILAHGEVISLNGEEVLRFSGSIHNPIKIITELRELSKQLAHTLTEYNLYSGINKIRLKDF